MFVGTSGNERSLLSVARRCHDGCARWRARRRWAEAAPAAPPWSARATPAGPVGLGGSARPLSRPRAQLPRSQHSAGGYMGGCYSKSMILWGRECVWRRVARVSGQVNPSTPDVINPEAGLGTLAPRTRSRPCCASKYMRGHPLLGYQSTARPTVQARSICQCACAMARPHDAPRNRVPVLTATPSARVARL